MRMPLVKFSEYSLVASFSFALDFAVMLTLMEWLYVHYILAAGVGFIVGHSIGYIGLRDWVFSETSEGVVKSYLEYLWYGFLGLLSTTILMLFFVEYLVVHFALARIFAGLLMHTLFFMINRTVTFHVSERNFYK